MLRIGLVGMGPKGHHYATALAAIEKYNKTACLAAVAELDPARRAQAQQHYGCAVYSSHEAMLADAKLDLVAVVTSSHLHARPALDALNAGCHVLCEKPLSMDPGECRAMIAAAQANRRKLWTGFEYRVSRGVQTLRPRFLSGELGRVCNLHWYTMKKVFLPQLKHGSAHMQETVHAFDEVRYLLGESGEFEEVVTSLMERTITGPETDHHFMGTPEQQADPCVRALPEVWDVSDRAYLDTCWTTVRLRGGAVGSFGLVAGLPAKGVSGGFVVVTDRASIFPGHKGWRVVWRKGWRLNPYENCEEEMRFTPYENEVPLTRVMLDAAVHHLITGEPVPLADGEDGFAAVKVALAAERAAKEGRRVALAEI
ncbi:MAG TPA: Gfo/Idh/MocA family oxidoreductase [Limnochordia bacterium]|nr:Gfo/Idh/MocA family oxidoreductase [Limnochordia bacterium]